MRRHCSLAPILIALALALAPRAAAQPDGQEESLDAFFELTDGDDPDGDTLVDCLDKTPVTLHVNASRRLVKLVATFSVAGECPVVLFTAPAFVRAPGDDKVTLQPGTKTRVILDLGALRRLDARCEGDGTRCGFSIGGVSVYDRKSKPISGEGVSEAFAGPGPAGDTDGDGAVECSDAPASVLVENTSVDAFAVELVVENGGTCPLTLSTAGRPGSGEMASVLPGARSTIRTRLRGLSRIEAACAPATAGSCVYSVASARP